LFIAVPGDGNWMQIAVNIKLLHFTYRCSDHQSLRVRRVLYRARFATSWETELGQLAGSPE
jgi:hypothetical protein